MEQTFEYLKKKINFYLKKIFIFNIFIMIPIAYFKKVVINLKNLNMPLDEFEEYAIGFVAS